VIRVISYNLLKNSASGELLKLVSDHNPDALCVQEAFTAKLPQELGELSLAGSTHDNRLGLAVYTRADRFSEVDQRSVLLKKSLHDMILAPTHERLIGIKLTDAETRRELVIASFHASPLTATNSLRRKQIAAAHAELQELGAKSPTLMVGDFNYPLFQGGLGDHVTDTGYSLTKSDRQTYVRFLMFRGHFDFVTSTGFSITNVETLRRGKSDHKPIMVTAEYSG
jgi:endonuclease/exonuclease/phosphatase family metal-dependent hydrolase